MSLPPMMFQPHLRPKIWGGRRLVDSFHKQTEHQGPIGESWEVSGHPEHLSVVKEGSLAGANLDEIYRKQKKELAGPHATGKRFPLMLKLLDCQELLSVQVHPDDRHASKLLGGEEKGKTEAWVVLASAPESVIYAGLKEGVDRDTFVRHLEAGTVLECLHSFHPKVGDCVFIPPGTVHTMGGGLVLAEVQQTSDATFRLFDFNRVGEGGTPRSLHVEQGLQSIDFKAGPIHPVKPVPLPSVPGAETLVHCKYFSLDRYMVTKTRDLPHHTKMSIWLCIEGDVIVAGAEGRLLLEEGDCVLIPASAGVQQFIADPFVRLLGITLPAHA